VGKRRCIVLLGLSRFSGFGLESSLESRQKLVPHLIKYIEIGNHLKKIIKTQLNLMNMNKIVKLHRGRQ